LQVASRPASLADVRFLTCGVSDNTDANGGLNIEGRSFDYVIVRRLPAVDPTLTLGAVEAVSCP
jgi:hypothetical protein